MDSTKPKSDKLENLINLMGIQKKKYGTTTNNTTTVNCKKPQSATECNQLPSDPETSKIDLNSSISESSSDYDAPFLRDPFKLPPVIDSDNIIKTFFPFLAKSTQNFPYSILAPTTEFDLGKLVEEEIDKVGVRKAEEFEAQYRVTLEEIFKEEDLNIFQNKFCLIRVSIPPAYSKSRIVFYAQDCYDKEKHYKIIVGDDLMYYHNYLYYHLSWFYNVGTVFIIYDPTLIFDESGDRYLTPIEKCNFINVSLILANTNEFIKSIDWIRVVDWDSTVPVFYSNYSHIIPPLIVNYKGFTGNDYYELGNFFYATKDYNHALIYYKMACNMEPNNGLYLISKANANFKRGDYALAIKDANKCFELAQYFTHSLTLITLADVAMKNLDRANSLAASAQSMFKDTKKLKILKETLNRLKCQSTMAVYNFNEYKLYRLSRLNCLEFHNPIKLYYCKNKSKVVAKINYKIGEIIKVCKAIEFVNIDELRNLYCWSGYYNYDFHNMLNNPDYDLLQKVLALKIGAKFHRVPDLLKHIYKLPVKKGYEPKLMDLKENYKYMVVDYSHVEAIIKRNVFDIRYYRMQCNLRKVEDIDKVENNSGIGLWFMPSYFRHSCSDNNAFYFFVGDMMFIKACKEIKNDEEITLNLIKPDISYNERQRLISERFGQNCRCSLCLFEKNENIEVKIKRALLLRRIQELNSQIKKNSLSAFVGYRKAVMDLYALRAYDAGFNYTIVQHLLQLAQHEKSMKSDNYIYTLELGINCVLGLRSINSDILNYRFKFASLLLKEYLKRENEKKVGIMQTVIHESVKLMHSSSKFDKYWPDEHLLKLLKSDVKKINGLI